MPSQRCQMLPDSSWPRGCQDCEEHARRGGPEGDTCTQMRRDIVPGGGEVVDSPTYTEDVRDPRPRGQSRFRMTSVKTSFIQPGGGSVAICSAAYAPVDRARLMTELFTSTQRRPTEVSLSPPSEVSRSHVKVDPGARRRSHQGPRIYCYIVTSSFIMYSFR